jgi:TolB-like protein
VRTHPLVHRWLAIVLAACLSGIPGLVAAQQVATRPRIAVLDLKAVDVSRGEASAATDRLRDELVNSRAFTVLDRAEMSSVTGELAFQQEGVTDPAQAVKIGKLLNAEYIVVGRLTGLSGAYQVTVQMIHIQSAEVIQSQTRLHVGNVVGLLSTVIPELAANLTQTRKPQAPVAQAAPAAQPAPPPSLAPAAPAAASTPAKPSWPLWWGVGLGLGAYLQQANATKLNDDAKALAADAHANYDSAKYDAAVSKRKEAEDAVGVADLLAVGAIVFLVVYLNSSPATAATATVGDPIASGLRFGFDGATIQAGWQTHW